MFLDTRGIYLTDFLQLYTLCPASGTKHCQALSDSVEYIYGVILLAPRVLLPLSATSSAFLHSSLITTELCSFVNTTSFSTPNGLFLQFFRQSLGLHTTSSRHTYSIPFTYLSSSPVFRYASLISLRDSHGSRGLDSHRPVHPRQRPPHSTGREILGRRRPY